MKLFLFAMLGLFSIVGAIHWAARANVHGTAKAGPAVVASFVPEYLAQYLELKTLGDAAACEAMERRGDIERIGEGQRVQLLLKRGQAVKIRPFGSTRTLYTLPDLLVEE